MYHVTKNNNIAKELNFFLEDRNVTFMKNSDSIPIMSFETQQEWEAWLKENHTETRGIWLKIAKKGARTPSVSYAEALDSALCYGWIDGQKAAFDDKYWLQKFTPRTAKSIWSKINCGKAEALIADGRMQPEGLRQVELAKSDGRWERAYESQSKITIPDDFQSELDKNPKAQDFFNTLDSANRYAFLFRIHAAKKPEMRSAKIQKFVDMLNQQQKLHP
ncbi:MAG TPA: YdeI/OmpD-associated family protein [Ktedonobacteraceae bacterium]|nr:YdeI/OmpD-associated family protein [Ktedonobacteraceae bacterium]